MRFYIHPLLCLIFISGFMPPLSSAELSLSSVYPTLGETDRNLPVTLTGTGFDETTRVSMYLDTGRKREIIGGLEISGEAWDVQIFGNTAYLSGPMGLHIIDVSRSREPELLSHLETAGYARRIAFSKGTVYIADKSGVLDIINVSNPRNPKRLTSVPMSDQLRAVTVTEDDRAYILEDSLRLWIFDVSNPSEPEVLGNTEIPSRGHDIVVKDHIAYVAMGWTGLQMIDVSNPSAPEMLGTSDPAPFAYSLAISDDKAYLVNPGPLSTGGESHLQIIDVADPSSPSPISVLEMTGSAADVSVAADKVYVTDGVGLKIVDAANPYSPVILGSIDTPGSPLTGLVVIDDNAYVGDGHLGLQIIDIREPEIPPQIGSVKTGDRATGIVLAGEIAYVGDHLSGLQIIDISNPSSPKIIASKDTPGEAMRLAVKENIVYMTDAQSGIQVIDVSDPSEPARINAVNTPGMAYEIFLKDHLIYVADWEGGLQIIDVTDPLQAAIIGSYENGDVYDVDILENTAYLATGYEGLKIIDVSDPVAPSLIRTMETVFPVQVEIVGETAYVTGSGVNSDNFHIIDVTAPRAPVLVRSSDLSEIFGLAAIDMIAVGKKLYLTDMTGGIKVFDISDPWEPALMGFIDTAGWAYDLAADGDKAFIANGTEGLTVMPAPVEIIPDAVTAESISLTIPGPDIAGNYTLNVFNRTDRKEMRGAVTFSQSVRISKAIILAGGGPSSGGYRNRLWNATQSCANYAYRALLYQGYTRENICYLTPDADFQVDGMYGNVDAPATYSDLSHAIRTWSREPEAPAETLLLYLTDHGGDRSFRINPDDTLYAEELDEWLDEVQEAMADRVILIYDACHSGSFLCSGYDGDTCLSPLMSPPPGKERIVVTSSEQKESALFIPKGSLAGGLSFSFHFWAHVYHGQRLADAFFFAKDMMADFQTPLLDAGGNGIGNEEEDRKAASGVFIGRGYQPASDIPLIGDVCKAQTLHGETSAEIWAGSVRAENPMTRIWAVITPPGILTASTETPILTLPEVDLEDTYGNGIYEGVYDDFAMRGTYHIAVYGIDVNNIHALTRRTAVIQAGPECDVNGDGKTDLADLIVALQILTGANPDASKAIPDLDGDKRIGLGEVISILMKISG